MIGINRLKICAVLTGIACFTLGPWASPAVYAEISGPITALKNRVHGEEIQNPEKQLLEQNWNIVCWHNPHLLIEELEKSNQNPELKQWSESVAQLIRELRRAFPATESPRLAPRLIGEGKILRTITGREENFTPLSEWNFQDQTIHTRRQSILARLTQKVHEARSIQKTLIQSPVQTQLIRTNYALQRRIILWNYCDLLLKLPAPGNMFDVSSDEWLATVQEVEKIVNSHPYRSTWNSYLRINALKQFPDISPDLSRKIAWQIHERLHSDLLESSQRQFLAQESFQKLDQLLLCFGAVRTARDQLMCDVEAYESAEDPSAGNRIIIESRRLAKEQELISKISGQKNLWRQLDITDSQTSLNLVYRNANLRLCVSETFLNSSLPQPEDEKRTIQENILNRQVYGHGVNQSALSLRMIQDEEQFRVGFLVEGNLRSSTYSPDVVTVYNQSAARYSAFKEVRFSATGLQVLAATANVENQTRLSNLKTPLDPIPLIGFVANGVARNQAQSKQEEANRLAENKIRNEVCSRLDAEVDTQLEKFNETIDARILSPLSRLELKLEQVDAKTTTENAAIRFRLGSELHPGAFTPRPVPPANSQINFQIHESSVNNFLQQFKLEGKSFNPDTLKEYIQERLPNIELGKQSQSPKEEIFITFANSNAVTVRIHDGKFTIRVAVKELRVEKKIWKNFIVEAPYAVYSGKKSVFIQREGPVHLKGRIPIGQQVIVRGVFSRVFQKTEEKNILPEKFLQNPRFANLVLNQMVIQDGWLGISFGPNELFATNVYPKHSLKNQAP